MMINPLRIDKKAAVKSGAPADGWMSNPLALFFLMAIQMLPANPTAGNAQSRGSQDAAILQRGNELRTGIPGFGDNAFAGFYGEYVLETWSGGESQKGPLFYVWVSREPAVLPPQTWSSREGEARIFEKTEGDTLLLTTMTGYEGAGSRLRRILFQFPPETQEFLGAEGVNRLVRSWLSRFNYFFSRAEGDANMSLPAILNY